jgi:hypothetical protein
MHNVWGGFVMGALLLAAMKLSKHGSPTEKLIAWYPLPLIYAPTLGYKCLHYRMASNTANMQVANNLRQHKSVFTVIHHCQSCIQLKKLASLSEWLRSVITSHVSIAVAGSSPAASFFLLV